MFIKKESHLIVTVKYLLVLPALAVALLTVQASGLHVSECNSSSIPPDEATVKKSEAMKTVETKEVKNTSSEKQNLKEMRDLILSRGIHMSTKRIPDVGRYFFSGYSMSVFPVELYWDAIMLIHFDNTSLAENSFKIALNGRRHDGFIPRCVVTDVTTMEGIPYYHFEQTEHCSPILFQLALLISRKKGSVNWITESMYETMKASLTHWEKEWDRDGNGLCEWASAPHGVSDTAFERAGVWQSFFCEGVDLNSQRYMDYLAGEKIARAMGRKEDAVEFASKAQKIAELVRKIFWDEKEGFFFDRDIRTGKFIRLKHGHCFHVLESGIATPKQAKRIIEEHLLNPKEFWSPYPIPSYAMNEPAYRQHYVPPKGSNWVYYLGEGHPNWCGSMWPHQSYPVMHGLKRYGYTKEAEFLAGKLAELVDRHSFLYEWYNAETGEGIGTHPFFAGAQALMVFAHAELKIGFDPYAIENVDKPLPSVGSVLDLDPISEDIFRIGFSSVNRDPEVEKNFAK